MAQPLIEDIINKVAKNIGYWETETATTTTGSTTVTLTRTGRTACTLVLPPPPGITTQSFFISENRLTQILLALEGYFQDTQNG